MMKKFLSVPEVAEMLGISKLTMYSSILKRDDFPKTRIGRHWLINKEKLMQWLDNGGTDQKGEDK